MKNVHIYTNGNEPTGVTEALTDILSQRIPVTLGLKCRRILRAVGQQLQDVQAERDRLLEQYPVGEDGQRSVADEQALNAAWQELMEAEFECETIAVAELEGLALTGWTLLSPVVDVEIDQAANPDDAS